MDITREKIRRAFYLFPLRFKKRTLQIFRKRCTYAVPVFLAGVHRSGTNMLLDILERSPDTLIYNENNRHAFKDYQIRDCERRLSLLQNSKYPIVLFKPLSDTMNINTLMDEHPECKVLWMYRGYQDVVNSAILKWGNFMVDIYCQAVMHDQWDQRYVTRKDREIIENYFKRDMNDHSAWALTWYLRNEVFFQYGLDKMPERVLLVKYEALVEEPAIELKKILDFLGIAFRTSSVSRVSAGFTGKRPFPEIDPRIKALCEEMMQRLNVVKEAEGN